MRKNRFIPVLACVYLLAGCGDKEELVEESTNSSEEEIIPVTEEVVLPYVTPFTGVGISNEMTQRPILATINNHPDARPQSGIAAADVIYEMLAEGDVTRLLGLYQSEIPETIGPIRSARDYFIELAVGLDAFYIAHGYSPEAQQLLMNGVVDNVNGMQYDGILFKRSSDRVAPHNSYFPGANLETAAEKVSTSLLYQKKVSYTFYKEDESVKMGTEAESVAITYSKNDTFNSLYTYDGNSNTYTRQSGNAETIDSLTNEPIELSNVLFFEMSHSIIDSEGRREIDITSGGTAFVFQQGIMREVRWENIDGVLKAVEEDGSEVKLVPGKTWVHFVPTNPGIPTSVKYS
ncbi:DUF3048 domain-containing protein [Lysinibacillus sp. SGAir0095]|uniref:DUF3048 domain-containing protein n=1 Tax=Lysinibacillus sp. SGAir0095 TaxID=2070463 RepID=UPI0010CCEB34|nr:DUF3048 domain-containing protein [Lysinibacillus sp. SGAir0095]QCR33877.1 DUF3048 domain-containing protein [Lysinibacillus sp. SGAir0095]